MKIKCVLKKKKFESKFSIYKNETCPELLELLIESESKPSQNSHQLAALTWPAKVLAHTKILDLGFNALMTDGYPEYQA